MLEFARVTPSGNSIRLNFSENLDIPTESAQLALFITAVQSAFSVTADGNAMTLVYGPSSNNQLILTVVPRITQGQSVVITYTDPTASDDAVAVQDNSGNDAASFTTGQGGVPAVTNNSTVDVTGPVLEFARVTPSGNTIRLNFSENLDIPTESAQLALFITAVQSAFSVTADGNAMTLVYGPSSNNQLILTVAPRITQGQSVVITYTDPTVESALTGVYPYARVDLTERVSAWALAGAGDGTLALRRDGAESMDTGLTMRMGALGVKGQVLDGSGPSGVAMSVKSDAMWVGTRSARSADLAGTRGDVTRLRLLVEGERAFRAGSGATFTPSAEAGLRHDAGDAETGTGLEVGAGVRYTVGTLSVEGRARALLAHEASGYEEWGVSGAVRVAPGASGRGLALSVAPEWGRTGSASQRLWSARDVSEVGGGEFEAEGRLNAEAGYGFALAHGRGVLTPYGALTLGDAGSRTMRAGARWTLGAGLAVTLEAARSDSRAAEAAGEVRLRAALRF